MKLVRRIRFATFLALCAGSIGCAVSQRHVVPPAQIRPALDATPAQLIAAYNTQAHAVNTVTATVRMSPVAGSAYSGVIEQYRDVGGFILAKRPEMIRVIGQAPVVAKDIFDMVSDGQVFRIFIPSKNTFLVGSTALERTSNKPIENLRPQHVLDAFFWPELPSDEPVLFEEADAPPARYYVLTLVKRSDSGLEMDRKIWFDRADLRIARIQIYERGGKIDSDVSYSNWQPVSGAEGAKTTGSPSEPAFPHDIRITRPQQDYQLALSITKLTLNSDIGADRFTLAQPPGTELVRVDQRTTGSQP